MRIGAQRLLVVDSPIPGEVWALGHVYLAVCALSLQGPPAGLPGMELCLGQPYVSSFFFVKDRVGGCAAVRLCLFGLLTKKKRMRPGFGEEEPNQKSMPVLEVS